MKTAIESAIDAMNEKTWTGLSIRELVKSGRIAEEMFEQTADELLNDRQLEFVNEGADLESIFALNDKFKAKCIEIMRINL